jgi:CBS domain-containing protein
MKAPISSILEDKGSEIIGLQRKKSVADAIRIMKKNNAGSVVVFNNKQNPVGLLTERDILYRALDADRDIKQVLVGEIMTQITATITPDTTIEEAMKLVTRQRIRHLLVMDNKKLVGVVSSGDLTKHVVQDQEHDIEELVEYISGTHY